MVKTVPEYILNNIMNLCIILTGQIRTFFGSLVSNSFKRFIANSHQHYKFIYIICIINESDEHIPQLNELLQSLNLEYIIDDYNKYIPIFEKVNQERLLDKGYQNMADIYNNTNGEIQQIMTPTHHSHYYRGIKIPFIMNKQWHQLEIGIRHLFEYETNNNIVFNVCMRMRFDTYITDDKFYPHCPVNNILSKITFNENILSILKNKMVELNIQTLEEYTQYLKSNPIKVPHYISSFPETSFGTYFFNNYISLENIIKGEENILYSFSDHLFFGKRDIFVKLYNLFNEFGKIESDLNQKGLQAFFCPEGQMLVFCFHHNINILMYPLEFICNKIF